MTRIRATGAGNATCSSPGPAWQRRWSQALDLLSTVVAVVHVDGHVEDDEDLWSVVDMPDVRLVSPVQPHGGAVDLGDVESVPGLVGGVGAGVEEAHEDLRFRWSRCGATTMRRAMRAAACSPASARTRCRHRSIPAAGPTESAQRPRLRPPERAFVLTCDTRLAGRRADAVGNGGAKSDLVSAEQVTESRIAPECVGAAQR